jgi:hypothetical protein
VAGIDPLPAQKGPEPSNALLMLGIIMSIRNEHPNRIDAHTLNMDATSHAPGLPTRHRCHPLRNARPRPTPNPPKNNAPPGSCADTGDELRLPWVTSAYIDQM